MPRKGELGRIGQRRWDNGVFNEEFLKELQGQRGIETYKEMADNDATVGAVLFAIEMLMRQVDFNIEPAGDSPMDKEAAEFVESCMYDMEDTWTDTLSEILSFLTYGWSYHEIVYKRRNGHTRDKRTSSKYNDGLIGWRKIPIRSQDTLWEWVYEPDSDDLVGMTQAPPPNYDHITIPIDKALHFKTRSRKANPEGRSILRNAYRSWYFLKRIQSIEGIGMERDLAGFPVITGPEEMDLWDEDDEDMARMLAAATNIVTSIRRDAKEGLVMPNGWKLELLSAGNRRQFDTNQIIDRYKKEIAMSVLADFIFLGQQSVGSFALSSDKTELFSLAIGTYLDIICEVFTNQAIPRLIQLNESHFNGLKEYPQMTHGDVENANLDSVSNFISTMVGSGALVPDEELEKYIRQVGNLPKKIEGIDPYPVPGKQGDTAQAQNEPVSDDKQKQEQEDKEDAKQAEEAKKSLGRMPSYDDIEEVKKFNPYHDSKGRFSSAHGGGAVTSAGTGAKARTRNYGNEDISDAIGELNNGKTNSLAQHIGPDGKLTPEREAVHKKIIDDLLAGKVGVEGQATMTMLGGGPASGKSSVMNPDTSNDKHAVTVDPDAIKAMLPGYAEMASKSPDAASYYHEESSALAKRFAEVAYSENMNVIYDGTGDGSTKSVMKKVNSAREHGYRVEAKYVTIDTEEAVARNRKRYDDAVARGETPRLPPEDMVRNTHAKVTDIAVECAKEFDNIEVWDNNGGKGQQKLIAKGGGGKGLVPTDSKAFDRFLDKSGMGRDSFITLPDGQVVLAKQ